MNAQWQWWLAHPFVSIAGWTLVHFVWQALAIAAAVALLLTCLRNQTASLRYAVACSGLLLMAIAPLTTATWLTAHSDFREWQSRAIQAPRQEVHSQPAVANLQGILEASRESRLPTIELAPPRSAADSTGDSAAAATLRTDWRRTFERNFPLAVALWLIGIIGLSIRLAAGLWRVSRWRREGAPVTDPVLLAAIQRLAARMRLRQAFQVLESPRVFVPAVIGWLRPVLLVPVSFTSGLTPVELESLLAHELAHVRRHDYLVNLLQTVMETIWFYHPAVWWLSQTARQEREHCCDDAAITACGNRLAFARALALLEERRGQGLDLAMSSSGGSLLRRVRRIVVPGAARSPIGLPAVVLVLLGLGMVVGAVGLSMAQATSATPKASPSSEPGAVEADESAASELQEAVVRPSAQQDWETHRPESEVVDRRTGQSHRVLAGVKLFNGERRSVADLKYSNVMNYTFIPAAVAKELAATELGVIDFAPHRPAAPDAHFEIPLIQTVAEGREEVRQDPRASQASGAADNSITVDELSEPAGERPIVPFADDAIWIPDHLGFYGLNPGRQTKFIVVRIERVDLGLGPDFGPVNALVIDDENTSLGVLGRNWAQRPRGPHGEGFVHAAAEGFYFMAMPPQPQDAPPNQSLQADGQMTVKRSGDDSPPLQATGHGGKLLATHAYNQSRRSSTEWIEVDGTSVPIDEGVEYDGVRVYVTLLFDVVATDTDGKLLWKIDWHKREPFWQTISVVAFDRPDSGEPSLAVQLLGRTYEGQVESRYVWLHTGQPFDVPASADTDARLRTSDFHIHQRDGDRIEAAALASQAQGRSPGELMRHFRALRQLNGVGSGEWVTHQETLVSAEAPNYVFDVVMEASQVIFNLPDGSGMRAEFTGQDVILSDTDEGVRVIVTAGHLRLIDATGVVRADASPDGGAERLVVDCRTADGEYSLAMRTERVVRDDDYPHPPVQVRMNTSTGAPQDEEQPPHGAVRYAIEWNHAEREPMRMKMRWHYELSRLAEEAHRAGRSDDLEGDDEPASEIRRAIEFLEAHAAPRQSQQMYDLDPQDRDRYAGWGGPQNDSDLRMRLTVDSAQHAAGQPVLCKLELKNFGSAPAAYDPQDFAAFRVLRGTDREDQPLAYIGPSFQTVGGDQTLQSGELVTLWENVDATQFYLLEPGDYRLQAVLQNNLDKENPASFHSNRVAVVIEPGELSFQQALLQRLRTIVPPEWTLSTTKGAVFFSHSPTGLKKDVTTIQIWFVDELLPDDHRLGTGAQAMRAVLLDETPQGYAYLAAPGRAVEFWPTHVEDIRAQLRPADQQVRELPQPSEDAERSEAPWVVFGSVVDDRGKPVRGATIRAHCGMGTLFQTGVATSDDEGKYRLNFGPGFWSEDNSVVQAATISVEYEGHFERNLHRQGNLLAALEKPEGDINWSGHQADDLVLPDRPRQVDFVMVPAVSLKGIVVDERGDPLEGVRVSLVGPDMPPSSSVVATTATDASGRFGLADLPTGFHYQFLIEPAKAEPPWSAWATSGVSFRAGANQMQLVYSSDGQSLVADCPELRLVIHGAGTNWKTALAQAADERLDIAPTANSGCLVVNVK